MMAELVQGQASVAQPGTKDDFADTIRRVRQVTRSPWRSTPDHTPGAPRVGAGAGTSVGSARSHHYYKQPSCSHS